jgi:uncharacterized membrane protein
MSAEVLALIWAACTGLAQPLWQAAIRRLPTPAFLALKWSTAATLFTTWALASGWWHAATFGPGLGYLLTAALIGPIGAWALYSAAIRRLDVSVAHPLSNTSVLISVVIGIVFLGERPPLGPTLLGALLIFIGVYLVQVERPRWHRGGTISQLGLSCALGAGFCYGVNNVLWKVGVVSTSVPEALWLRSAVPAVLWLLCWGVLLLREGGPIGKLPERARLSKASVGYVLTVVLLADVLGFTLYFKALEIGDVAVVAPLGNTAPLFSGLVAMLVLREPVRFWRATGIIVCVAGVVFLTAFR